MKRRRKTTDRSRRRRWRKRAAERARRHRELGRAPVATPAPVSLVFGDVQFAVGSEGLRLSALDYHVAPVHLTTADLASLGLTLTGGPEDALPPSVAKPWRAALRHSPDRMAVGPARTEPNWSLPPGRRVGGFLLARVSGGLDVLVTEYHARKTWLSAQDLAALGLAWVSAGERAWRDER